MLKKAAPGAPLSADTLIAIGAIIWSPPDSAPTVWQDLARQYGATLNEVMFPEVRATIRAVRKRLDALHASPPMLDQVATVAKMQYGPPPVTAKAKAVVTGRTKAPKKPAARKKRKSSRTDR